MPRYAPDDSRVSNKDIAGDEIASILLGKIQETQNSFPSTSAVQEPSATPIAGKHTILSLFSGCGGLDLGIELAGIPDVSPSLLYNASRYANKRSESVFQTIYVNDYFKDAIATYEHNFPESSGHASTQDITKIASFPRADVVLGGISCQGFSLGGPRLLTDPRNFLYLHFMRAVQQANPKVFIAENVKGMLSMGQGEAFRQIVEDLSSLGYKVSHRLLLAADYGVPQLRERVFIVGVRDDIEGEFFFPEPTHAHPDLAQERGLSPWVGMGEALAGLVEDDFRVYDGGYSPIFLSRNRKKNPSEPSFTIQAGARQAPMHPAGEAMVRLGKDSWGFVDESRERRLSVRESARIQSFPDWFKFLSNSSSETARTTSMYKQIGNAVPPLLAYHVGLALKNVLQQ